MKTNQRFVPRVFICAAFATALSVLVLNGCEEDSPASVYDANRQFGPAPTISAIVPADSAIMGVNIITISGANFSPVKEENFVFFDSAFAQVLSATTTQIVVKAPVLTLGRDKDSVRIKISVPGSDKFSETKLYRLLTPVEELGRLSSVLDYPFGIESDNLGYVHVSFQRAGSNASVSRILLNGKRDSVLYSPPIGLSRSQYSALKFGPGRYLYGTISANRIYRIPAGGGVSAEWVQTGSDRVTEIDFDAQGNLWAGGSTAADSIVRIRPDGAVRKFWFPRIVRSVRVFQGGLFIASEGKVAPDTVSTIVRFPIVSPDSLGPSELYFNFGVAYPGYKAYAITFAQDGDMFVGTDNMEQSIIVVHSNRSSEVFYPGLIRGKSITFSYGRGSELFVSQDGAVLSDKRLIRIRTQKPGAPYYGRAL